MIEWEDKWEGRCRKRLIVSIEHLLPDGSAVGPALLEEATEADLHILGWVNDDDLRAAGWVPGEEADTLRLDCAELRAELRERTEAHEEAHNKAECWDDARAEVERLRSALTHDRMG